MSFPYKYIFIFLLSFCIAPFAQAAHYTYTKAELNNITTTIVVDTTPTVATFSIGIMNPEHIGIENHLRVYKDITPSGHCQDSSLLNEAVTVDSGATTYAHTFTVTGLTSNKQYCFEYTGTGWTPQGFWTAQVPTPTGDFFAWPLVPTDATGQTITIGGKIDTAKYGDPGNLTIELHYSKTFFPTSGDPAGTLIVNAHDAVGDTSTEGVASDGSYYWQIKSLSPSTKYYCRQVIIAKNTGTELSSKKDACFFDSSKGYIPEGSTEEKSLEDSKTYNLLAPWPGLAKLYDPDLCTQKKAEGKVGPNEICDINGFINFVFKTLIGLTAVVLVLRLMYEGYQYIVTDVPFLKASAKSGFMTALMGLLLALSAYLILNTINPKLVSNTINVNGVNVSVDQQLALEQAGYDDASIKNLSPDDIKNIVITYQGRYKYIQDEYIPARDSALPSVKKGIRVLITAHTAFEGFYPATKSYKTKNPGNIGNSYDGPNWTCSTPGIHCFDTLGQGIQKQYEHINGIVNNTNPNYKIGVAYAALGGATYDGSLYQYIKIYALGAQKNNTYLSYIISYFKKEGYTITGYTKMSEIANLQ